MFLVIAVERNIKNYRVLTRRELQELPELVDVDYKIRYIFIKESSDTEKQKKFEFKIWKENPDLFGVSASN